jgi:hypothetical protein
MSPHDVSGAVEAYAAYLNAPRGILPIDEQVLFDQDLAKARAAMDRAWLEATPVREDSPVAPAAPEISWFQTLLGWVKRAAGRVLELA